MPLNGDPTFLFILDSGAFSTWTRGEEVDLEAYIAYCLDRPAVSYYVNLDVIPGRAFDKRSVTPEETERACRVGWDNYLRMCEDLPKHKVLPVFHENDNLKWLRKYLDHGVEYIGISPANDSTAKDRLQWMTGGKRRAQAGPLKNSVPFRGDDLRKVLFDGAGRPVVRTHGFGVTSFDLMNYWEWHSVDSASWKLCASWGGVYFPRDSGGKFDFGQSPMTVSTTTRSPNQKQNGKHYDTLKPYRKQKFEEWLDYCGVVGGEHVLEDVGEGHKLDHSRGEVWQDKRNRILLRPIIRGVVNSLEERLKVNARFIREANKVLPVEHIYFAGAPMPYPLEYQLGRRLLSYGSVGKGGDNKYIHKHLELMEETRARRQPRRTPA